MLSEYIANIREKSGFDNLEKREKTTIIIGICFVLCFLILQFGITPYIDARQKVEKSIKNRKSDLVELQMLQQEYRSLRAETGGIKEQLSKRAANFSLFTFLDTQAAETDIKDLISYMKPATSEGEGDLIESSVEMKLQRISLQQLVDYLARIESPENVVSIERISIQESNKDNGGLEVVMQVVTFLNNS